MLVVGQQQADHRPTRTYSRKPPSGARPISNLPSAPLTRSRSPARPLPVPSEAPSFGPIPSSTTSTLLGVNRTVQVDALLCRTTLVTPSLTTQPNSSR